MKTKGKEKNNQLKLNWYYIAFGLVLAVLILSALTAAYSYAYEDKTLLNTYLEGKNISSKTKDQVEEEIRKIDENYTTKTLEIGYQEKSWEMPYEDISWKLDSEKTSGEILSYGHSGSLIKRYIDAARSVFLKKKTSLQYSFNEAVLIDWLNSIDQEIGSEKKETNLVIKKGEVKVTDSATGKKINDEEIKEEILRRLSLQKKGKIEARLIDDEPAITKAEAQELITTAQKLVDHDLEIVGPGGSMSMSQDDLGSLIKLKKRKRKLGFIRSELGPAYVSFDDDKIKSILQKNLEELNTEAVDAKFTISGGAISLISPSKSGEEIKIDESASLIIEELERDKAKVVLPSKVQEPSISAQTSEDIKKIGVREIIGTATTDFKKSPQNRIHNIQTGMKYISGAIVKPGEEFSTVKRLGSIDQSGGYLPELVIKENETTPEFGGGLCQVSSTLFRAALNSGLKITERQNHSYRVSYYEPPVGMDATIYSPRPDFKFVNDTNSHILIYGYIEGTKITFDFYGTKDGRQVEITDPEVFDITNPPEPIYKDDPTLEPGEVRQIDKAHQGAKAVFYYKVRKDGKLISDEKFVSSYVPWAAKFLRGPSAEGEQTASPTP